MILKIQILAVCVILATTAYAQDLLPPGSEVLQNYNNGSFDDSLLIVHFHTINDSDQCRHDKEEHYSRAMNPEVWIKYRQKLWEYDQAERITSYQLWNYDFQRYFWHVSTQFYQYNGNLLARIYSNEQDVDYLCHNKNTTDFTYDGLNRIIKEQSKTIWCHYGGTTIWNTRTIHYDSEGRRSVDSLFYSDYLYNPREVLKYHYNNNNQLDSLTLFRFNNSILGNVLNTYEYTESGLIAGLTTFNFIDDWIPNYREEYEYDTTLTRKLFTYQKKWNPEFNDWYLDARIKYDDFCTDEIVPEIAIEQPLFRLYPNPGREIRLLALSDIRNVNVITVRDIRGVVVYTDQFQWPYTDHVSERSLSIPPGFYFVSISSENYLQELKWIKF